MTNQIEAYPQAVSRVLRFDRVQRTAHWANALLFGILMLTALALYFRLSCRSGGDLPVRELDLDACAAEIDHRDEGVG